MKPHFMYCFEQIIVAEMSHVLRCRTRNVATFYTESTHAVLEGQCLWGCFVTSSVGDILRYSISIQVKYTETPGKAQDWYSQLDINGTRVNPPF